MFIVCILVSDHGDQCYPTLKVYSTRELAFNNFVEAIDEYTKIIQDYPDGYVWNVPEKPTMISDYGFWSAFQTDDYNQNHVCIIMQEADIDAPIFNFLNNQ